MRISDNRWRTRAVCAVKIRHCAILLCQMRTNEKLKSVCIMLCCCVKYVEICTEQRELADGIDFLFSFEENCRWVTPISSKNLRRTCSTILRDQNRYAVVRGPLPLHLDKNCTAPPEVLYLLNLDRPISCRINDKAASSNNICAVHLTRWGYIMAISGAPRDDVITRSLRRGSSD